eukprot:CAMPEP_0185841448 /NCGR_PEP_ID=MMETSP1353-20130828/17898_1 /TAXON_ID=1077150 /ORGANISM="Erythrolobus australicus, Strain CCMP3124" /LENGTH=59 /DNA_ID=CAMNT_0028540923 /DNA_START=169 /DNA_END=348 /DNA_ORIENTATION=+
MYIGYHVGLDRQFMELHHAETAMRIRPAVADDPTYIRHNVGFDLFEIIDRALHKHANEH